MKLEMRCTGECNRLPADFHVIVIEDTDATMDAGSIGDIEDGDESEVDDEAAVANRHSADSLKRRRNHDDVSAASIKAT